MRSVWRGAISFGLVTIAVKLYTATEEHNYRFHQVHREDGGRIKYQRVCSHCGKEIDYADIVKGYETESGAMVLLDSEDFDKLPVKSNHAIDVVEFVPAAEIDPIYFGKSYYLEPDKSAARPYVLLRQALLDTDRYAVVKITIRQRETLAMLRPRDDLLVLQTMLWPDEIRTPDFEFLNTDTEVRPQELQMATSLVHSMAGSFNPEEFTDDYKEAIEQLIAAKAEGAEIPAQPEAPESGEVIDLMSALEQSVEKARSARAGSGGDSAGGSASAGSTKKKSSGSGAKSASAAKSSSSRGGGKTSTSSKSKSNGNEDDSAETGSKKGTSKSGGTRKSPSGSKRSA
jgi:DNA end-binding protein Ku